MAVTTRFDCNAAEQHKFEEARLCIYCGSQKYALNRAKLGDEHVVPEGLGGQLILPWASCQRCEVEINRYEQFCQKDMLLAFRAKENLPTKRLKDRPKELPAYRAQGAELVSVMVPIEEYPLGLMIPKFPSPELLRPHPLRKSPINTWHLHPKGEFSDRLVQTKTGGMERLVQSGEWIVRGGHTKDDRYAGMLAKIAHSYAIGELGLGGFVPLLWERGSLEDKFSRHLLLGGIDPELADLPSDTRHPLSLRLEEHSGTEFWIVYLRLFADLGWPAYRCIVGPKLGQPQTICRRMIKPLESIVANLTRVRVEDEPRRAGEGRVNWSCAHCSKLLVVGGTLPPHVAVECGDCGVLNRCESDDRAWVVTYKDEPSLFRFHHPDHGNDWFDDLAASGQSGFTEILTAPR